MMNQKRKRIIQKLWGWFCLSINYLIMSLHLIRQNTALFYGGILVSVSTICYGALKTQADKLKGDTSVASIVIEYVCVYIITFLSGFEIASYFGAGSVLIVLAIASLVELLVFLIITNLLAIRHFFNNTGGGSV